MGQGHVWGFKTGLRILTQRTWHFFCRTQNLKYFELELKTSSATSSLIFE